MELRIRMSQMPDDTEVFQCRYCRRYAPLSHAIIAWAEDWRSDEERTIFTMSVACGSSCAAKVNDLRVSR